MATPNQEAIETFMSITGSSESVAIQKLTEHGGDLNEAVNSHFTEGDRNIRRETSIAAPHEDFMDIDDPSQIASHRPPFSLLPSAREMNPFSILDPNFTRSIFDSGPGFRSAEPFVSHPREVRQIPIEVKDGPSTEPGHSGHAPRIEDVTETAIEGVPETRGHVIIDEDDDDDFLTSRQARWSEREGVHDTQLRASAPLIGEPDYGIEEEMIRAAIEASKQDSEIGQRDDAVPHPMQSQLEDPELAQAVSLSLKTAEQEKALRELGSEVGPSEPRISKLVEVEEVETLASSNGRLDVGSSSIQDEAEDAEEQPLVRNRSQLMSSSSIGSARDIEETDLSSPSSPQHQPNINHPGNNRSDFPSDEWGGISSEEHDEAVMLEAALFGGIPEGTGYRVPYAPHQYMQNGLDGTMGPYPRPIPRPPSPSLTAQRLIREQQDDEYLASLQADREKELLEQSAREAAMEEERRKEEEALRKLEEEQEMERQLAAKEASLPQEPTSEDENAVTLLVRMPDGSRRGRRFLRTDKLQYLFNFIDVARVVKPGMYRLVRPYPRRAFSDGESNLTLNELGLTSKQEALFLESI
ncbi:plant UBX domain-containing protein 8-like isoform X1 [Cynara cardunculus var. scolymus]|uniref:plant UBX domain-containing protein 8-like isoform X1 n=2 Tax=Cynara cardunculus var. scolymus TaxID=59895 RepID=UPI000D62B7F7|nr:plant UBX domain-containing protein 8-like isoform X1 [Cynara cardunculus var. scolymus]